MSVLTMSNLVIIYQPWMKMRNEKSIKVTQKKGDLLLIIAIFRANLPPEDQHINCNNPFLVSLIFSLLFN